MGEVYKKPYRIWDMIKKTIMIKESGTLDVEPDGNRRN
jgi:hypothetical protein